MGRANPAHSSEPAISHPSGNRMLAELCPDLAECPYRWQVGDHDAAFDRALLDALTPFARNRSAPHDVVGAPAAIICECSAANSCAACTTSRNGGSNRQLQSYATLSTTKARRDLPQHHRSPAMSVRCRLQEAVPILERGWHCPIASNIHPQISPKSHIKMRPPKRSHVSFVASAERKYISRRRQLRYDTRQAHT